MVEKFMGITDIVVGPVSTLLTDLVDRIFPDKDKQAAERAAFLMKGQELDNQLLQGQLAINQAEASNANIFISGWRPFIGWVCGMAFAYKFIIQPFLILMIKVFGSDFDPDELPVLDWSDMSPVLIGLLGLGIMKTTEKIKGV